MADIIGSEPIPMPPAPQVYPGAFRPGLVPGAAAGQFGAPLSAPSGPAVVFGAGPGAIAPSIGLQPGELVRSASRGHTETGRAGGDWT